MSKLILSLFLMLFIKIIFAQNYVYVNLSDTGICQINWGLNKIQPFPSFEFWISNFATDPIYNGNWAWHTSPVHQVGDAGYPLESNLSQVNDTDGTNYLKFRFAREKHTTSIVHSMYPVIGKYSGAHINTITKYLYGYFEMRCKTPASSNTGSSFWLYAQGSNFYNEIDIFELGSNDELVMTNHWGNPLHSYQKFIFSLPGQKFSDNNNVYAAKWEPNKVVWYINNYPVKIVKDLDSIGGVRVTIPDHPLTIIASSGAGDNVLYSHNIPESLPNYMMADYINVYQRGTSTYVINTADPVFVIDGHYAVDTPSVFTEVEHAQKIIINASESYIPDHKYAFIITKLNSFGMPVDTGLYQFVDKGYNLNSNDLPAGNHAENIDLVQLLNSAGFSLQTDTINRYKVTLTWLDSLGNPTQKKNLLIHIKPSSCINDLSFTINGQSAYNIDIDYNFGKSRIVADLRNVKFCDNYPMIRIRPAGTFINGKSTILNSGTDYFDVDAFCKKDPVFPLYPDSSYDVIIIDPNISNNNKVIHISECENNPLFTIKDASLISGIYHIHPGDEIIIDGTGSIVCDNIYSVTVKDCVYNDSIADSFNYYNESAYYYANKKTYSGWDLNWSLGYFDVREFCRLHSLYLKNNHTYSVILRIGSSSVTHNFKIEDAPFTNHCNFHMYRFDYWQPDTTSYYLTSEKYYLYSPNDTIIQNVQQIYSNSFDNSYSVLIRDDISDKEDTIELLSEDVYKLKVTGSLYLNELEKKYLKNNPEKWVLTDTANKKVRPGFYTFTLKNSTAYSGHCVPESEPDSALFSQGTKQKHIIISNSDAEEIILPDFVYSDTIKIISDKTLEEGLYTFFNPIKIKSGHQLTVKGELQFYKHSSITVEKGAKLIINGGKLTSLQDNFNRPPYDSGSVLVHEAQIDNPEIYKIMWQGIIVEGDQGTTQVPLTNQGFVKMMNGAVIENAVKGIYSTHGGIVWVYSGCSFINCLTGIEIRSYPDYDNISKIECCTFETNDFWLRIDTFPQHFIYLNSVYGIRLWGNVLKNTALFDLMDYNVRGTGICAVDAGFNVLSLGSSNVSLFQNLNYGINAKSTGSTLYPIIVDSVFFDNNYRGIYLSGLENTVTDLSYFTIPDGGPKGLCIDNVCRGLSYGLYLDNCTGYEVEENTFRSHTGFTSVGLVVNNSGEESNMIYKNTFDTLSHGAIAQYCNRGMYLEGLEFRCNTFNDCLYYDIAVAGDNGIAKYQGSYIEPAGNLFSHDVPCLPDQYDFINIPSALYYFYDQAVQNAKPDCYHSQVTMFIDTASGSNDCASHLGGNHDPEPRKSQMAAKLNLINQLSGQIQAVEDGGDTEGLTNEVLSAVPNEALQLRNDLLTLSPYLSDSVMVSSVNIEDVLSAVMVKDILVANPHSAKSDTVLKSLDQRINPLPEYMIDEINEGRNELSPIEIMKSQLHDYGQSRQNLLNKVISYYLNDTVLSSSDSLVAVLEREQAPKSRYSLISYYLTKGDTSAARQQFESIPENEFQSCDYLKFHDLFSVLISLKQNNLTYYNMDSLQVQTLRNLADDYHSQAGALARNIISIIDSTGTDEIILLPEFQNQEKSKVENVVPFSNDPRFEVYPNPSLYYFIIDYCIPEEMLSNARITITDATGKSIFQKILVVRENQLLFETITLSTGTFQCFLYLGNKLIDSRKLLIIR